MARKERKPLILVGGYYRSGTTYLANLIGSAAGLVAMEPDAVGGHPWNEDVSAGFLGESLPGVEWIGFLPQLYPGLAVCKCVQGALRWQQYVDGFRAHFEPLQVVYITRDPRGVTASHIFRGFPFGFDFHSVNQNLVRAVRLGWPHNKDNQLFQHLVESASRYSGTPLVTVAQWLAHTYNERQVAYPADVAVHRVRFCDLVQLPSARRELLRKLGPADTAADKPQAEWPSTYEDWGGGSGWRVALRCEQQLGEAAEGAIRHVKQLAEQYQSPLVAQIIEEAEWKERSDPLDADAGLETEGSPH